MDFLGGCKISAHQRSVKTEHELLGMVSKCCKAATLGTGINWMTPGKPHHAQSSKFPRDLGHCFLALQ